uniref:Uncharacterized protein n=1 Tax=Kwoniella bestiolae CBS 10118 TaxID=1296100 RepID=A0A1B9G3R2_9TREE|nr:hypothetical protein I302_05449 [Kwoniella bestiolae CBS 10118]OCF25628.1 hypothetical protein I302_05449 [Kwoniella bestiolae CBS 10118]
MTSSPIPAHFEPTPSQSTITFPQYNSPQPAYHRGAMRGRGVNGHVSAPRGRGGRGRGRGAAQRQTTPPFLYMQQVNGSPAPMDIEPLPPNHIHIVQTQNPMHRTDSTFSTTSVPPPLSNGPSSTEGSFGDVESYHTSPLQQGLVSHAVPSNIIKEDGESLEREVESGTATQAVIQFIEAFNQMRDGTFDEWLSLIDEHFEQGGRFQLMTSGEVLQSYDVPATSLPRFFTMLSESGLQEHRLNFDVNDFTESQDASLVENNHIEWHSGDEIWRGSLSAIISLDLRLEKLELIVETGNLPESAIRLLDVAASMECMMEVIDLVETRQIEPDVALKEIAES